MIGAWFSRLYSRITEAVDKSIGWYKLLLPLGLLVLIGLRFRLRESNLADTSDPVSPTTPSAPADSSTTATQDTLYLVARTPDGTYNDLNTPSMGSANTRFGRNVPLKFAFPASDAEILKPNPRLVSQTLLTRKTFQPATSLNLLVAAWVQFMIHDWFSHGKNQKENPWEIQLAQDDPWPEHPMKILRTHSDPTRTAASSKLPPTYLNTATHWWDASQLYGSDKETQMNLRSGKDGKLALASNGLLPIDPNTGVDMAGVNGNWWIGLSMMQTLFTLEHNAICDRFRRVYPSWNDDELFEHARLVNAALIAKIHTVNWTTAILGHPTMQVAMNANWWGLATERIYKMFGRISKSEIISGIPGSPKNFYGVPYSMTEEFVTVYRMHPLLPDVFSFRSVENDQLLQERTLPEVVDRHAHEALEQVSLVNALYSFGTSNPGAIQLHNYPSYLQRRQEPDGSIIDLATTEILRDRERGVPRYNEFRKLMHKTPVKSFEELTDNPEWREELRRIYNNDIEQVDVMIGMYAEKPPEGFGFSDTAFRIFILMASRRLESDRFFTTDYTPQVYTQTGLDWISENDMHSVLVRHFPALEPAMKGVQNVFAPWARVGNTH